MTASFDCLIAISDQCMKLIEHRPMRKKPSKSEPRNHPFSQMYNSCAYIIINFMRRRLDWRCRTPFHGTHLFRSPALWPDKKRYFFFFFYCLSKSLLSVVFFVAKNDNDESDIVVPIEPQWFAFLCMYGDAIGQTFQNLKTHPANKPLSSNDI